MPRFGLPLGHVERLLHGPAALLPGLTACFRQQRIKFRPWDEMETEPAQVPAVALAVIQQKAPFLQMAAQNHESDLRRVRLTREHRFGDEGLADRYAIKASGQLSCRFQTSTEWA